jgi:HlyD family secretion protein
MNLPKLDPDYCIENQIFKHSNSSKILYSTALLFVASVLAALPLIQVDIIVRGVGVIRPITEKVELTVSSAERILSIHVRDGCNLRKGDTILKLDPKAAEAGLIDQKDLLADLNAQQADLELLCRGGSDSFKTAIWQQEQLLYQRQKEELALSAEAAQRKLERNRPLFEKGVIPKDEFENYQLEQRQCERQLNILSNSRLASWKSKQNELQRQRSAAMATLRRMEAERRRLDVIAPVSGTLEQCSGLYPGITVQTGQVLGVISPDSTLVVECYLPPKDIGFLRLSMHVDILVEAFDYNQWGKLKGTITAISSDFVLVEHSPVYKVRCSIDHPYLSLRTGQKGYLKKGMTVQTRFILNRRSLFHLIYEKMDDWINPLNN